ncbi:MAG: hypothetical protein MPN21_26275, partial [Thermoanaerobaculia bacterium]|nr:hypothetical protein [Thermoanaerobaculia bacterium]
ITPAQIWVYRGVALVGLVLGIALLRRGLPPVHRPRMGVAWLLASSIACAVAASVWFEYSQSRAWVLGTVAGLTCMLGLRSIRR